MNFLIWCVLPQKSKGRILNEQFFWFFLKYFFWNIFLKIYFIFGIEKSETSQRLRRSNCKSSRCGFRRAGRGESSSCPRTWSECCLGSRFRSGRPEKNRRIWRRAWTRINRPSLKRQKFNTKIIQTKQLTQNEKKSKASCNKAPSRSFRIRGSYLIRWWARNWVGLAFPHRPIRCRIARRGSDRGTEFEEPEFGNLQ